MRIARVVVSVWLGGVAQAAAAQTVAPANTTSPDVAANPGRPTVAAPATLTPVGYLQFETGALESWHFGDFQVRFGLNEVAKLAVHRRLQLIVASEPIVWSHAPGAPFETHAGGVAAGGQVVLRSGSGASPTVGVGYLGGVYSGGAPDLDLGSPQQVVVILVSNDMGAFHLDANASFGDQTDGGHHLQSGGTVSVSRPVGPIAVVGEIYVFSQPLTHGTAAGTLWAMLWARSKILVFDAGFAKGLSDTSTSWNAFTGFTCLVPRKLWK